MPAGEFATYAELIDTLEKKKEFIFLETGKITAENRQSFLFTEPLCWLTCRRDGDARAFLAKLDQLRHRGFFLAGWFNYEFSYLLEPAFADFLPSAGRSGPLAGFGVFENPMVFDHRSGSFPGGKKWSPTMADDRDISIDKLRTNLSRQEFLADMEKIHQYIRAGDTYQVNYTFMLDFLVSGPAGALYRRLCNNQSVSYTAWIRHQGRDIMSFSPELFFRVRGRDIKVRPMKGTLGRGRNMEEDQQAAERLCQDEKSRSENVMIVDLLRNDLASLLHRIGGGRVEVQSLFDVEVYESLLQMTSTIKGQTESGPMNLADIIPSLFPCGSVTGAPKIRAMEIIRELEREDRGVYCGAIGYCGPDSMCFNVPIRTLTLENGRGRMGIGAGIVNDSDPGDEWRECLLKAEFLTRQRPVFHLVETLLWHHEKGYVLLQEHLERLAASAAYFFFHLDLEEVGYFLDREAAGFATDAMRVRVLLGRDGTCNITSSPLPPLPDGKTSRPVVAFSSQRVDPADTFLYHKTTFRPLFIQERQRAEDLGLFDILFVNTRGEVTEGTITTIFSEHEGCLYTPPEDCGLLPGTLRRHLLESGRAREKVLTVRDLQQADKLYVGNSVRGLVRVQLVDKFGKQL